MKKLLLVMLSTFLVLSCSKTKKLYTQVELPREYKGSIKKVAVLPFETGSRNINGREIALEIESYLASAKLNGKPYYDLVSRSDIDKVLKEQKFSYSGLTEKTVEIGKILNAEGIIVGYASAEVNDSSFYEDKDRCIEKESIVLFKKCKRYVPTKVRCHKIYVTFTLIPKLIDVTSGKIVYSKKIEKKDDYEYCEGEPHKNTKEIIDELKDEAIEEFIKDIAPHEAIIFTKYLN